MQDLITRAHMLLQQNRPDEAAEVLTRLLSDNPNDPEILSLLGQVSLQTNKHAEARRLIERAISITPEDDHLHYLRTHTLVHQDKYDEAEKSIKEAINLNPTVAEYFGMFATIKLDRKKYEDGLELANRGLELDAENVLSVNARGRALLKLNRKEESFDTLEGALRNDPNNAYTHASFGWSELEKGDHKKALKHFRESLKNDPSFSYAQAGMIQALKAKFFLYRWFLSYTFWMSNMTARYQWAVILGFYFGFRFLRSIANNNPDLAPILNPVLILLTIVALSTWIATPISNLFLRLNVYGKHLLSDKEKLSSNLVGMCVLISLAGVISLGFVEQNLSLVIIFYGLGMMIPCSVLFQATKQKYVFPIYAAAMAVVGMLGIFETFQTGELYGQYAVFFLLGFIAFQWMANYFLIKEDNL